MVPLEIQNDFAALKNSNEEVEGKKGKTLYFELQIIFYSTHGASRENEGRKRIRAYCHDAELSFVMSRLFLEDI